MYNFDFLIKEDHKAILLLLWLKTVSFSRMSYYIIEEDRALLMYQEMRSFIFLAEHL